MLIASVFASLPSPDTVNSRFSCTQQHNRIRTAPRGGGRERRCDVAVVASVKPYFGFCVFGGGEFAQIQQTVARPNLK